MPHPTFFDTFEPIYVNDPLAEVLGAFENGNYTLHYSDIVKAAGHSCPTVAGAYLMALIGLKALYPEGIATRGMIEVCFKEASHIGVTGVIAQVLSHITGATQTTGFKGLGGAFVRHGLMHFDVPMQGILRLKRIDTNQAVELTYDHSSIPTDSMLQTLMPRILKHEASAEEKISFGRLWQERVEAILNNANTVITIR